jgi:hypothetical protein
MPPRRVFIATKGFRAARAPVEFEHISVDVTSAQHKNSDNRKAFSPMHVFGPPYKAPDGMEYACFEHYWQSIKVYDDDMYNHTKAKEWWRTQKAAKRRYSGPGAVRKVNGKNVRSAVKFAVDERFKRPLGYVESRKLVYVPDYISKIKDEPRLRALRKMVCDGGKPIVVWDFDGPKTDNGAPACLEVTLTLLREKIADERHPFGHGYVVAAALLDIGSEAYAYDDQTAALRKE